MDRSHKSPDTATNTRPVPPPAGRQKSLRIGRNLQTFVLDETGRRLAFRAQSVRPALQI